ncbi:DNA-binding protein [Geomicrobium sp. JCM 19039]|uniref:DNA-binding protein n=1 Tax=Geomicrobium sp. JCM 19039 TaxID=1460636 RepID=UPI00045F3C89|nr:DNA-binding protein [Geomicrobium sp. JCM 19039]GAK14728.1 hypothetical protein JCM19039_4686 [Geomicrobium sp. JCM 19039]
MDGLFWIGIGMIGAAYFIGDGLKNWKNPEAKGLTEKFMMEESAGQQPKLIKQNHVHHYIGLSKEDSKRLIEEHAEVPHVVVNGNTYYPRKQLETWTESLDGTKH